MSIGNSKTLEHNVRRVCDSLPEMQSRNARRQTPNRNERSLARLESLVNKLENISEKLAGTSFPDSYEEFGKYIASLLRGLPEKDVHSIKSTIINYVARATSVNEKQSTSSLDPSENNSDKIKNSISRGFKRKISVVSTLALSTPNSSETSSSSLQSLTEETNITRIKQLFDSECTTNDFTNNSDLTLSQEKTESPIINNNSYTCSVNVLPFRNNARKKPVSLEIIKDTTAKADKPLSLSSCVLRLPLNSVNSCNANITCTSTNHENVSPDCISEESKKEKLLTDDFLSSASNLKNPYEHFDIGHKCEYFRTFKPPLRTYNAFKKKKKESSCVFNVLASTSTENRTVTLKPPINKDTHASVKLTCTPAENNTAVTLQPLINEDRHESMTTTVTTSAANNNTATAQAPAKENMVRSTISALYQEDMTHNRIRTPLHHQSCNDDDLIISVDNSLKRDATTVILPNKGIYDQGRCLNSKNETVLCVDHFEGPENCLLDIQSDGVCGKNATDNCTLSSDLTEKATVKCEEDMGEPNQHNDSLSVNEVTVKCEEDMGEPNQRNDSLSVNEETKEENIFDTIFCGDTNLEIKEEIADEVEIDRDISSTSAADPPLIAEAEIGLKVFTCCHCTQIFFDHNRWLAHNSTEHQTKKKKMPTAVIPELRYDKVDHWPSKVENAREQRCRFENCKKKTRFKCKKCAVNICPDCMEQFHVK